MLNKITDAIGELIVYVEKFVKQFIQGVKEGIDKARNK